MYTLCDPAEEKKKKKCWSTECLISTRGEPSSSSLTLILSLFGWTDVEVSGHRHHTGTTMNAGRSVTYAGTEERQAPCPHRHIQFRRSHTIYKDHKSNENGTKSETDPDPEPPAVI